MTSSRKHRSSRPKLPLRRILVIGGALAAFALVLVACLSLWAGRANPDAAVADAERSVALLKGGNPTGARDAALAAIRNDPGNGAGHLALAQAMLALGDGVGADAEIQRAIDGGQDAKKLAHLHAHALLLQGEEEKAIDAAEPTDPAFRAYGLRIRARALAGLGNLTGAVEAFDMATRIAPNDAALWSDIGRFKFNAGDMLGAIEASQQAVKLDPDNIDALVLRGQMVRSQFGLVASLPWFEAALKHDPANHDALIEYAATLGDAGRTVDSLAAARRAMEARPGSAQALYLEAVIAARADNVDLARSLLGKAGGAVTTLPGALLLSGSLDLEAGDYQQASEKLGNLVAQQPMNIAARKLLAVALLRTDAARNAIDALRPVVTRADADTYSLTLAARAFERIGERDVAARLLDRAAYPALGDAGSFSADDSLAVLDAEADEAPGDPNATIPAIRALLDKGDKGGALARAQQIASRNAGAPAAHLVVGDVLMLMNRPADAVAAYQRAADVRFDEPTMLRLIEASERAGRREDAANTLALFLSQNPVNIAALRVSAHWQLAGGDYDAAVDTLELLRNRVGDGDAALNAELAQAYAGADDIPQAIEFGEAAYALAPSNPAVADAFGWALFRNGDAAGALELLQKAVVLAPRHPGLRWHLAQVYDNLGRKPEARLHAQAALADPAFTDRTAASALIARLG